MNRIIITLKNNWKKFKWRFIYSKKKRDKLLALLYSDPIKKVKDYYKKKEKQREKPNLAFYD